MVVQRGQIQWNRVLIDVCTQRDFLDPGAILQVANLDDVLPSLNRVFEWCVSRDLPVVSIVESHRKTEPPNGFPLHCIDGSVGQQKIPISVLTPNVTVETDNYLSLPPDLRTRYRQVIFRKRSREVLSNPKTDRFLTQLDPDEFIILGTGLERSIKSLALGLLARHKTVTVVSDCCGCWSVADAELALRQLAAKGIRLVTSMDLTKPEPAAIRPRVSSSRRRRSRQSSRSKSSQNKQSPASVRSSSRAVSEEL
jgi:nicotinamidase-related amidase